MATQLESDSEVGVTTLLGGIVQDARALFEEQMTLFKFEIENDARHAAMALAPMMMGMCVIFVAFILLGIGVANLINWAAPEIPLWVGYAIVGGFFALAGAGLLWFGKSMFEKILTQPHTALQGLKENFQWKTKK